MADVLRVQQETMIPMESFRVAISLFKEQSVIQEDDHFQEGFLTKERLGKVLRNMAILDDDVHRAMVEEAFSVADVNGDGLVSFTEFADWFSRHGFRQELNVDPEELQKRQMSRDLGISFLDMDFCKRDFESFDADGNGTIDKDEFYEVLLKCFKVPRHIGLPQRRVQQLWKDADRDGSGTIDFEEFVIFYRKHFIMN